LAVTTGKLAWRSAKLTTASMSASSSTTSNFMAGRSAQHPRGFEIDRLRLRQQHAEARASLRSALHAHGAAVTLDDGLDDPQTQPEPGRFRFGALAALETLEDRRGAAGGNARPFIFDPHLHLAGRAGCAADADGAALGGEFGGIGKQVDEHLHQALRVAGHDDAQGALVDFHDE